MTSRERFEAWATSNGLPIDPGVEGRVYADPETLPAWDAWQAAERQALERAAERCMSILGYPPSEYYAKAIRELMEPK